VGERLDYRINQGGQAGKNFQPELDKESQMKLKSFMVFNGILFAAAGVAFALYGPLMMAFFNVPELNIDTATYWHLAAFVRMFGAALFGWGMLLWGFGRAVDDLPSATRRGGVFAMLLSGLMASIISLTQQSSIWYTPAGWVMSGVFILLTLVYGYFLVKQRD
jgi:hypothetical protein